MNTHFFSHIVAASKNNCIGWKDKLPWHIPEDLKFFYNKTKGKALIMGRKTFESLGKPLPHRLNVIVTRQQDFLGTIKMVSHEPWGYVFNPAIPQSTDISDLMKKALSVVVCSSIKDAMDFCSRKEVLERHGEEIFISGGGEIYKQTLSLIHRIYLTRIHKDFKGDAFYPEVPIKQFYERHRRDSTSAPVPYSFITYEKRIS